MMTATERDTTASVAPSRTVIGGADTHADTVHVAAIDALGRPLGDREFATTPAGYRAALAFLADFGDLSVVGVEGSSSYGLGLSALLQSNEIDVKEVTRPDRSQRRRQGKSDPIDAYQAARAVLDGRADATAKSQHIEQLRALLNARRSAVKAASAAMAQIHQMLVNSPTAVREKYRPLKETTLVRALAASRPGSARSDHRPYLLSLKMLAQRHLFLHEQASSLHSEIAAIVADLNHSLMAAFGFGPVTAAQLLITAGGNPERLRDEASFAALCGTAPVPASSGRTTPAPPVPRRRPRRERRSAHHRHGPPVRRSSDPRLRLPSPATRAEATWKSCACSSERSRGKPSGSSPTQRQHLTSTIYAPRSPGPPDDPSARSRQPGRPHHDPQPPRARPAPQQRPRQPLPDLAQHALTPVGASV